MEKEKIYYVPLVEVVTVEIEQGFATSDNEGVGDDGIQTE